MCELAIKTEREHHAWRLLPPLTIPRSANGSGVWGEGVIARVCVGHERESFQWRDADIVIYMTSSTFSKKRSKQKKNEDIYSFLVEPRSWKCEPRVLREKRKTTDPNCFCLFQCRHHKLALHMKWGLDGFGSAEAEINPLFYQAPEDNASINPRLGLGDIRPLDFTTGDDCAHPTGAVCTEVENSAEHEQMLQLGSISPTIHLVSAKTAPGRDSAPLCCYLQQKVSYWLDVAIQT